MNDFKDEIKAWLKKIHKDRHWLAEKTHTGKSRVDSWLARSGKIPKAKEDLIRNLMNSFERNGRDERSREDWRTFSVLFSIEEYRMIQKAAKLDGLTVKEWSERKLVLNACQQSDFDRDILNDDRSYLVAEDPDEYGDDENLKGKKGKK